MKNILLLSVILLAGCSANRVKLEPHVINNQTVTFVRGSSKLNSNALLKAELAVLEYSSNEMVIALSVTNPALESILFSENNLTANRLALGVLQHAIVFQYDELVGEASEKGYGTAGKVGNTAISIGASFIPFGGIALSVGRLFYDIGSSSASESHEERVERLTYSQLDKNYIRRQTIEPGGQYSGILKIGFEDDLEAGDSVIFTLSAEGDIEKFVFKCKALKGK